MLVTPAAQLRNFSKDILSMSFIERYHYKARHKKTGQWLHMSGQGLTDNKKYGWSGTQNQFKKLADDNNYRATDFLLVSMSSEVKPFRVAQRQTLFGN